MEKKAPARPGKKTIGAAALAIIMATVALEGGYVFHPSDPGGETNRGVTKAVAVSHGYTGPMRTLPLGVTQSIYFEGYLVKPGYAPLVELDAAVTAELFDTTVNMGPARPSRWFQQSLNALCGAKLSVDGKVGRGTVAAFAVCQRAIGAAKLCVSMLESLDAAQRAEYDRLVRVSAKLKVFHRGWIAHRIGNVDRRKCATVSPA